MIFGDVLAIWRKRLLLRIAERQVIDSEKHNLLRRTLDDWRIAT
jgi:hypothetical protein